TLSQKAALQQLQKAHPGMQANWTGERVTRLYGRAIVQGATATEAADQFVERHVQVFGVKGADLVAGYWLDEGVYTQPVMYDHETGEHKFTLVYYSQHKDGIPVFRSELRVLVANQADHPVVLAVSTLRDLGDFATEATVVRGAAAAQANTGMEVFSEPETVIWAGVEDAVAEPRLAITFTAQNTQTDQGYEAWRYVCDASTGEILHQETLIHFIDVTGSIDAMATPGAKANICTDEILFPYPWARVDIEGGSSVYADGDGNFTIPNAGTSSVNVRSYVDGLYFAVENRAGAEETLSQSVTPPGPADFTHNEPNTDDLVLAQVNIYVSGNQCRDWVLVQNPSFPGVATETGVPTVVNRTDVYCPCNAWSDSYDGSINFCQPGGGCPNTAWQSVLNHEYGHHCIDFTGSGQGEYGEGMADCFSMLPVDDPNLGYGFSGDCNSGLRTADNNCQYLVSGCSTCGSEIHDCGQLLSGCVWSIRNELIVTEPVDYLEILSNIVINSILVHTGTGIDPQIAIDFLTLDDDDANIGNGTPHRAEICAGFEDHGIDCPEMAIGLSVSPTADFASAGEVGGPFTPGSKIYTVENLGPGSIDYQVTTAAAWLTITNGTGSLPNVGNTAQVTVSINSAADALAQGRYSEAVSFVNTTDHVGDTTRDVDLAIGIPDECTSATVACPGMYYSDTTVGMTNDGSASCGDSNSTPDMWYSYTPDSDGTATFSLCTGTSYDSVLSVHSGCPGGTGNELGCDDDGCGTGGGPSTVTIGVFAHQTYLIRVTGWQGSVGSFSLVINGPACGTGALTLSFPDGLPETVAPGVPTDITVRIENGDETYVPGSGTLYYRYDGGSYQTATLTSLGGELYQATLPSASCSDLPEFYFSAEGDGSSTVYSPVDAPTTVYSALVGTLTTVLDDDFETDQGWTVTDSIGLVEGTWERGIPLNNDRGDPPADYDGSGQCYLTENDPGDTNSDVDDGTTTVTSPVLDMSDGGTISYAYWLNDIPTGPLGAEDSMEVEVATNVAGDNWATVRTYTTALGAWRTDTIEVGTEVTASATVRIRFSVSDLSPGDVVEGGLDAFVASSLVCESGPTCDDGELNQGEDRIDCGGPCPACECTSDPACDNTVFCDGAETCDAYGDCQAGTDPCPGTHWCKESTESCILYGDGDFEPDGDVDLDDFASFQMCFGELAAAPCEPGNLNGSGMIDLADYADFEAVLGGPN
ncbi:MAG: hypothetical protein ABIF77_15165, partial [bacterium]